MELGAPKRQSLTVKELLIVADYWIKIRSKNDLERVYLALYCQTNSNVVVKYFGYPQDTSVLLLRLTWNEMKTFVEVSSFHLIRGITSYLAVL